MICTNTSQSFFVVVKSLIAEKGSSDALKSLSIQDGLQASLDKAQKDMEAALSDSFDTPRAMRVLSELIKEVNIHISSRRADADIRGIEAAARWVTKMVGIFGLDANAKASYNGLGWANSAANSNLSPKETVAPFAAVFQKVKAEVEGLSLHSEPLDKLLAANIDSEFESLLAAGSTDPEALVMPYLRSVSRIRDEIRKLAPTSPSKKQILALSDRIRDDDLTNLGVYLDDRGEDQGALIKFVPKEELLAQREEKAAKEQEKLAQKEAARLAREKLELEKAEKAKVSPLDMFRDERFSAWDVDGLPTKTKDGEDVPKSGLKKMKKDWERQKKAHEEWKAKNGA
jgi:cysteinyl-tRNA synthetase